MARAQRVGVRRLAWPGEGKIFTEGGANIGYVGAGYTEPIINMVK